MVRKILKWLDCNLEPVIASFLFICMTLLVFGQVILRFVFKSGFSWAEELSRFMFVWLVYLCLSHATKKNRHISLTVLKDALPETGKKIFSMISDVVFFAFSLVMLWFCMRIVKTTAEFGDMAITMNVSRNVLYASGVAGFLLNSIRLVQNIVWKISRWKSGDAIFSFYNSDVQENPVLGVLAPMYEAVKNAPQKDSERGE